ncbi:MAG TPA: extracellular solute-binding protein [Epulopiscium sp.]|nr:extracellular solute-binding protein [Candidatus Epulonipiscium sp.]
MKRKFISITMFAIMTVSLLGGCGKVSQVNPVDKGKNETPATEQNPPSTDEEIVLRFSWWGGDERNEATMKVIDQFEALHENVTIEAEYGGNDGYHDKLATQLASGTAPDIIQVDPEVFPKYIAIEDYFYDYLDYGVDVSDFDEAYISLEINGRYDGKQLGLPSGISGAGILVNKELAEAIGIDFNKDYVWEDLIEMGKKVREYDDSMYLLCLNKEYITNLIVFNYAKQLIGTTLVDATDVKLNVTEAQMQEVYAFVQRLYDEEVVAPASYQTAYSGDNLQSDPNWINGKYVATYTYISTMDVMAAANESAQFYAGKLPSIAGATETGWASNTPQVFAITKAGKHPEMAAEFMNYFFNDPTAQETLGTTRSVPATASAREICAQKGLLTDYTMEGANIAGSMGGTPNDRISSTAEAKAILFDATETIGYGMSDPAKAAADTIKLLTGLVK